MLIIKRDEMDCVMKLMKLLTRPDTEKLIEEGAEEDFDWSILLVQVHRWLAKTIWLKTLLETKSDMRHCSTAKRDRPERLSTL